MPPSKTVPSWLSTLTLVAVMVLWGVMRLQVFTNAAFPLTYVLPLLLCIWTRRWWHLWLMMAVFPVMATLKYNSLNPGTSRPPDVERLAYVATVMNIAIGGAVVAGILVLRARLDSRAEEILRQNAELEAQTEELFQQNEEIRAQSEELAQQTEEIEAQSAELARRNEELLHSNSVLGRREEVLQAIVDSSRGHGDRAATLREVCRRALLAIGAPGDFLGILERSDGYFRVIAQVPARDGIPLPETWPCEDSLADLVMREDRTAYVDDFEARPDLQAPARGAQGCRSALMTPLYLEGRCAGVVVVCSAEPAHWSQEQFRLLEWSAAQCALLLESSRRQQALRERHEALESANRAKDAFLASLSHELRTPLTPVLAVSGLLERDQRLPEDVICDIRMIQRNVAVQSRLIDDLLDLTRIARGKMDLNLQLVCVATLLRQSAETLSSVLNSAGLKLDLRVEVPEPALVHGDGARLQQVFWNILNNSIKFSPGNGVITVTAHAPGGDAQGVELVFSDQGPGIAEGDVERIFQPFEQVAAPGQGRRGGLGLGLSIARAIAELHDGQIHAWPAARHGGGRITVRLPLARAGSAPPPEKPTPAAEGAGPMTDGGRAPRILLVEDHEDTGRSLCRLLARRGYEPVHAQSCAEALTLWGHGAFDFIISDLGLPDGTGVDLIRRLHALKPGVPAICMSGYGMESDISRTLEAGFRMHLIKPVRVQALEEAIQRIARPTGAH